MPYIQQRHAARPSVAGIDDGPIWEALAMLEALILVCALSVTPDIDACEEGNAIYVMRLDVGGISPSVCARDAQAYIAGSSLLDALKSNGQLKILCQTRRN